MISVEKLCQDYVDAALRVIQDTGYTVLPSVDMWEWLAWMEGRPVRAISPLLDPRKSDPCDTFWLKLVSDGEIVGCIVYRCYRNGRNYFAELRNLGGHTIIDLDLGQPVTYTGGLYVEPLHRGLKAGPWTWANHLPRIARAMCMRDFQPNWHCGLVVREDAARGLVDKYGYEFASLAIEGEESILGKPTDFVLPFSSSKFMLSQIGTERKLLEAHTHQEGLLVAS